jgi:hypothetical protein
MTETHTTETKLSRTRKLAVAAALVAGLSGAFAVVGISAASSDPGSDTRGTQVEGNGPMDLGDPADCEYFDQGHAMFDQGHAMFDQGHAMFDEGHAMFENGNMGDLADMMGEGFSGMGDGGPANMMGAGPRMGS